MTPAEIKIAAAATAYGRRAAAAFEGLERLVLVEAIRSLDEAAFAFTLAPNRAELVGHDTNRNLMLAGAAAAIEPLVEKVEGTPGGVPWGPSARQRVAVVDQHLITCGRFMTLSRLASAERYGLAQSSLRPDGTLVIEVASDAEDADELEAGWRHVGREVAAHVSRKARLDQMKDWVGRRLDRSCGVADGWYLRYDGDAVLAAYHREFAKVQGVGIAEAEALPPTAMLGGREFRAWVARGLQAQASAYQHVAYATRLRATHQHLDLRNLLTCFARRDDIVGLWASRGEPPTTASKLVSSLTLGLDAARTAKRNHEIPLPYYVDFGRDFVLLPLFGALLNPYAGQVWHLRANYRKDWDRAVGAREGIFRDDLRRVLEPYGCTVPGTGFKLRRRDGTVATDVDAVVQAPEGRLCLVQLKWPDIHGRSLSERNSRQKNLSAANAWVETASTWCSGRSSREVASAFGLGAANTAPPGLLVLSRYAARFTGSIDLDRRATWVSWPRFCEALANGGWEAAVTPPAPAPKPSGEVLVSRYALPGLDVEVRHHA